MNYRADIDGLRAIAVLLVLLFHAGFKLVPAGFIGVDVFFVISGFLISGIIHKSLLQNHFSLSDFYKRRLWRLQPVFICLLICTTVVAWFFYLPEDLMLFAKSARKSSTFLANTFFARTADGYFAPDNQHLPLLHTWSLSIEWQYYLLLPLAMYLLHKLVPPKHSAKMVYGLTILCCCLALYFSKQEPVKSYYQLLSRLFEFLLGASMVFAAKQLPNNKLLLNTLSALALASVLYLATNGKITPGYPNGYALILCAAVAWIIAAGEKPNPPVVSRILAIKPLVFIGLISYSLYIWHWPIFACIRYLGLEESLMTMLSACGLAFVAAYLSWRFIEKPARKGKRLSFTSSVLILLLLPITLMHISDRLIKKQAGYPQRFDELMAINQQLNRFDYMPRPGCLQQISVKISPECRLGSSEVGSKTGLLMGDSHANHYWGFIDNLAKKAGVSLISHATVACLALPGIVEQDWNKRSYTACHQQIKRYYDLIDKEHYNYVILGQNWDAYTIDRQRIEKALDKGLQRIIRAGSIPVVIQSLAANHSYNCFLKHLKQRVAYDPKACNFNLPNTSSSWQQQLFSRMQKKYPQLIIIDPKRAQCPEGKCEVALDGVPIFRDYGHHVTDYAAYHLAQLYLRQQGNPLA